MDIIIVTTLDRNDPEIVAVSHGADAGCAITWVFPGIVISTAQSNGVTTVTQQPRTLAQLLYGLTTLESSLVEAQEIGS